MAETGQYGLSAAQGIDEEFRRRHVTHPRLDGPRGEILDARDPPRVCLRETEKLPQVVSIRPNPARRFAMLSRGIYN